MATGGEPVFHGGGRGEVKREEDEMQTVDHSDHGTERDLPGNGAPLQQAEASDCFAARMSNMISDKDIHTILAYQGKSLSNFEKTNEKFKKFNDVSAAKYESVHQHFKSHTKVLIDMQKDLETVFRRIRALKAKLNKAYPTAFIATSENIKALEELAVSGELEDRENIEELIPTAERKLCTGDVVHVPKDQDDSTTGLSQTERPTTNSTTTVAVQATTMQATTMTTSTMGMMTSNARECTATEADADGMTAAGVETEQKD